MFAPVIDSHVHVWTDDRQRYPRATGERDYPPSHFTPEDLFPHAKLGGVQRAVLTQMSFYRFDNSYMLDCMRRYRRLFSGVGIVDSFEPTVDRTMRDLARHGVRGFRITPGDSPQTWLDSDGIAAPITVKP